MKLLIQDAAVALGYFALAALAVAFTRFDGGVAMLWPAGGALCAVFLTLPARRWARLALMCVATGCLATRLFGLPTAGALLLSPVAVAESASVAALLLLAERRRPTTNPMRRLARFVAVGGLAAPAVYALVGGWLVAALTDRPFGAIWQAWFVAHALGTIVMLPMARGLQEVPAAIARARGRARGGGVLLLAAVFATTAAVFGQHAYPLLFLPMLPLVLVAFLLGLPGAAAAMLTLVLVGGTATILGDGPIALIDGSAGTRSQFFQLYLATASLIAYPMAAELSRRAALFTQLRRSEASYRLLADRVGDVLLRLRVDGTIDYASPSIIRMGGLRPEDVVGRSAQMLVTDEDRPAVIATHLAAVRDPATTAVVEYRFRRPDGQLRWLETHTRAYCDENGHVAGVVSAIRDVSQRKATEHELLWEATTDPLTGIGNRRAFDRALARAMTAARDEGRSGCVAIFDIDHFKAVNDAHGHDAGDAVIRALADTLRGCLREGDFAARLGGEEFGLVLGGVDEAQAAKVCERVRAAFAARPVSHAGGVIQEKTASAGVCALARAADPEALVRLADEALYRAKRGGRDRLELAA